MALIFKILPRALWEDAITQGSFKGAGIDLADGYIHFSAKGQVVETAEKHFAGQDDLLLVAVDADALGDALKWEVSRGGALFPHLHEALDPTLAEWVEPLPSNGQDGFVFPERAGV